MEAFNPSSCGGDSESAFKNNYIEHNISQTAGLYTGYPIVARAWPSGARAKVSYMQTAKAPFRTIAKSKCRVI